MYGLNSRDKSKNVIDILGGVCLSSEGGRAKCDERKKRDWKETKGKKGEWLKD